MEGRPTLSTALVHSGTIRQKESHHVHILQLTGYKHRYVSWRSCACLNGCAVGYTADFTAVPLYKGVSLFLLQMSGSAPATRRDCTHDKRSQDTASSKAVCSCNVRLSTNPGWTAPGKKTKTNKYHTKLLREFQNTALNSYTFSFPLFGVISNALDIIPFSMVFKHSVCPQKAASCKGIQPSLFSACRRWTADVARSLTAFRSPLLMAHTTGSPSLKREQAALTSTFYTVWAPVNIDTVIFAII